MQRLLTRATWLKIHLYLALSAGFLFALMGLSGSISIYREALDELLNPQLIIEAPQGNYQSLDRIMAAVRTAHPNRYGSWTLEMPRSPQGMITAWYDKPTETFFELYSPLMVSVNPYTADVVMSRFWGQTATTWLLDLHTQLRLDGFGWNAIGVSGILLITSCATGLYLWWPGIGEISQALQVRHKAGMMKTSLGYASLIGIIKRSCLINTGIYRHSPELPLSAGSVGRLIRHGTRPNRPQYYQYSNT